MENLLLDIGNTSAKMAYASGMRLEPMCRCSGEDAVDMAEELLRRRPADTVAVSSVRADAASVCSRLARYARRYLFLDCRTPVPLRNAYATPQTLGADRMAAAVGAHCLFPDTPLLVFDFGTALTVDRVTADGVFCGGNIAPGLGMRFNALHDYTGKLPRVGVPDRTGLLGDSTVSAIQQGVASGIIFEVEGYLREFSDHLPVFTGGDAFYFAEKLKTPIFVVCNLVLTGLARIAMNETVDE